MNVLLENSSKTINALVAKIMVVKLAQTQIHVLNAKKALS